MGRTSPPVNLSLTTVACRLGTLPRELEGTMPPFVMTGPVTRQAGYQQGPSC